MIRPKIAIVDDDTAMVETLCDILELHGWDPMRAYNGEEAVGLVKDREVDVVLMDIRMPRMNGVDALREIKLQSPSTRVVLFTASAAQDLLARAERYGATRILKKPLEVAELLNVLNALRPAV
ncbi:MAG: response regulator [Gemmatimonadaceae bacterium]